MEKDWKKIQVYNSAVEAEIVKQMLEENGVHAVLLNKQDSSYLFGKIELYVHEDMEQEALRLIKDNEENNIGAEDVN
ncbi:putative signal transducing protein [Sphingobacterium paucimobilis]|uniref:DUF2007 domain-containing protein n=1 Tax=Sphingobacterium paucimobilis HER1398 TaxID=1346330 RepID=U2H998_9SPHI|nr:DUF2007 domain-containing protein [Sphingobacterium paucimobilis]ERJ58311.1 hypothetical protein M472_05965 [Sphingobacterium paucimobilis HER1398]